MKWCYTSSIPLLWSQLIITVSPVSSILCHLERPGRGIMMWIWPTAWKNGLLKQGQNALCFTFCAFVLNLLMGLSNWTVGVIPSGESGSEWHDKVCLSKYLLAFYLHKSISALQIYTTWKPAILMVVRRLWICTAKGITSSVTGSNCLDMGLALPEGNDKW